ncbi:hypothetical protein B0A49_02235 [Cryomyces minteri]|uniref:N-acetylglucosamine-6-phosphate deacetylase n=1 Tax=Cryomyces minteri TaxID=331657 RepID=A0A4U0XJF6_9PEZI|nr:hypothetical protein B0A49_02235 [Cryomyces minteri]
MPSAVSPERPQSGITKFTNCRLVRGDSLVYQDLWISAVTGKILRSQEAFYEHQAVPDRVLDLGGRIISPGFIDVQLNGAFGFDFSVVTDDVTTYTKGLKRLNRSLVKTGVTSYLPTLTSQKPEVYRQTLAYLGPSGSRRIANDGSESLGAHCEGPFLNPTKNGIHNLNVLQSAPRGFDDIEECYGASNLQVMQDLSAGQTSGQTAVRMITAAPEVGKVRAAIPEIASRNIIFSIGHSEANYEEASAAVEAGATMVTHLFNAMRPLHHRNPGIFGILGQADNHRRPFFGIIADGIHLHPTSIKIAWNAHPGGFILVTDAMRLVGLPDGLYDWTNGDRITKKGPLLTLEGSNKIAGSSISLVECVSNFLTWSGASIPAAIKAVTSTPAEMLGLGASKGTLNDEADADLVILTETVSNGSKTLHVDQNARTFFRRPPSPAAGATVLLAALSPAAFVQLSEQDTNDGKTAEQHMLDASRAEIAEYVPEYLQPIATGLRFLHLVFIFVPVIVTIPVIWLGSRQKDRDNERSGTLWWYGFLVSSMERSGAAFIKLGQWAASRSDIFPVEMCRIMGSLHSNAPAHSLRVTKKTVEKAFRRPFGDIFEEFQEQPLGVGAIAQVYKAKLKPDFAIPDDAQPEKKSLRQRVRKNVDVALKSTPQRVPSSYVAIKVLHPKVERIVRRDLRIMGFFASMINAIPTMEWLSLPDEVAQFGEMMRLQLDLRIESANLTIFRKNFRNRTTAWFPYPHTEYTTRQVLVEEFAHGIPLDNFLENGGGVFQKEIADEGLDAFLRMLLIDNFIHADLHPGNIMVRFYKPEQLDVRPNFSFFKQAPKPDPQKSEDVTEEVLQRLRPHRNKPNAWVAQLQQIDEEGYRPQLIFIDTGLVTELNAVNRANFLDLFKAIASFDGYKAGHLMCERCRQPDAVIDKEVFALRMQHLVLGVKSQTFALGNIKIGDILNEVLSMVRTHHVRLEGDFVNVVLSILLLEGIGRSLDPNLDLFSGALPILRQLGSQGGASMVRSGDLSMVKIWAGLEARKFLQISIDSVERCVKYDQLSPNI